MGLRSRASRAPVRALSGSVSRKLRLTQARLATHSSRETSAGTENGLMPKRPERRVPREEVPLRGRGADHRPGHQPQPERRAHDPHRARALLARGHVGDRGGRDREVAAEGPAHDARDDEEPERAADEPDQVAEGGPRDRDAAARPAGPSCRKAPPRTARTRTGGSRRTRSAGRRRAPPRRHDPGRARGPRPRCPTGASRGRRSARRSSGSSSTRSGPSGKMIEKPIRSIRSVRKMTPSERGRGAGCRHTPVR